LGLKFGNLGKERKTLKRGKTLWADYNIEYHKNSIFTVNKEQAGITSVHHKLHNLKYVSHSSKKEMAPVHACS